MTRVVIVGTGVVAYGVIDECFAAGHTICHVTTKLDDTAARSRFIDEHVLVDLASVPPSALLECLVGRGNDWSGALLIPVNDPYVYLVASNHERLSQHYVCAVPPWDRLKDIVNKNQLYDVAHAIGVPAPQIACPESEEALEESLFDFAFPCILKPFQTPQFFRIFGRKVHEVHDRQQALDLYRLTRSHRIDVMVSEIIPGPETNLFSHVCLRSPEGEILAESFVRKVRENTEYGVASVIKTIDPIEDLREMSLRLLSHFNYVGFSGLEAKRDERDGRLKLIEINTRPVLYHRLFKATGVNYMSLMYDSLVRDRTPPFVSSRPDVNWIHNVSEFFQYRRRRRGERWSRRTFCQPYREPHVYALPFFRDPLPLFSLVWKTASPILRSKISGDSR